MEQFELTEEQIDFLKKEYSEDELIKSILDSEKDGAFEVDTDTEIELMDYLEDESVYWMDANQEATPKTYMLESIRDNIYYQIYQAAIY